MPLIKKVLSSLKNIHFQSLLGNGVMAIFGLVITALLFHVLSVYEAGVYFFFMMLYNFIDTVKAGFLTNAFVTFYAGTSRERAHEVAGSSWTLALIISIGLIVLNIPTFFIASYITDSGTALYLKYFSVVAISTLPSFMANLVVQGDKRFDRLFWLRLVNQVLYMASIIMLMVMKKVSLASILIAFTVTNFLAGFIIMFFGWTMFTSIKYTTKKALVEIYHFGKYSVATSLSSNLFRVTDTFFINFYLGAPAVALYNLGSRWMPIVDIPLQSFASSSLPLLSEYYNNEQKEQLIHVMKKMIGMLSIGIFVLAILAIIFAEPLILLVGGKQYIGSQAPNLFRMFISIAVLFPADRFAALTLDAIKKPKINFYKILIMLLVNLIADFVGVSLFKSVYAVVATNIFPVLAGIIISYVALQQYQTFSFWNIYVVGYTETKMFLTGLYNTVFHKKTSVEN
jgi:O-antigen/teichoic acid export membrane protein